MFGCEESPRVLEGAVPVTLELLSPAGRPLQRTSDLAHSGRATTRTFNEMRGRYPKHPGQRTLDLPLRLQKPSADLNWSDRSPNNQLVAANTGNKTPTFVTFGSSTGSPMSDNARFGFVNFAETWNGRLAMLGFVIGLTELLTGQGILSQIGLG